MKGGVKSYIKLRSRGVDDSRPQCLDRQVICTIGKGCVVKKRSPDVFIFRIKSLFNQGLLEVFDAVSYFSPIKRRNTRVSIISLFSKKEPEFLAALRISLQLKRILSILSAFSTAFLAIVVEAPFSFHSMLLPIRRSPDDLLHNTP